MFIGANVREAINDGRADYTPIYLSEIEGLFESGEMPLDVALIEVSPPDSHGFCSFDIGVDTTLTPAKCARHWPRSTTTCRAPTATASFTASTTRRHHHFRQLDIKIAGFGGQGVLLLGQLLAEMGMREGPEVQLAPLLRP
jgi:hypothetical protein